MPTLVRLRIALADRPGALARVATMIADAGGNITGIDVHRSGVVSVVDDVTVEFPDEADLNALRDAFTTSGAATLLSHQTASAADPVVAALERAAGMLTSTRRPSEELADAVSALCQSPVAWVDDADDAERYDAGRYARERQGAIALRTSDLPAEMAERLPGEVWLLAVPDPEVLHGGRVVFVARAITNEFTSTEIARIEALMGLHDRLERFMSRG